MQSLKWGVWFVVTARVMVILMHSDLDAVTEVGCVWFVVTARVTVILMHSDLDAVTEVGCVWFVLTARVMVILMQSLKWGVCGLF